MSRGKKRVKPETDRPRLTLWPQTEDHWPEKPALDERAEGWPDGYDDDLDGVVYEPRPAAVLSARGYVLGRFPNAADAVAAMHHWPQGYIVVVGGCVIATRDDRLDAAERRAA